MMGRIPAEHAKERAKMDAFRTELVALLPQLRVFARGLAGDRHLADDLVQDTVMLALQAQAQFTPGTNLRAWLFTILRNRFCAVVRRRPVTLEALDEEALDRVSAAPAFQEATIEIRAFRRAFAQLGWTHREVLVLVGVHGLPYEQVAAVCGCEVGTVKSRLHRARDLLGRLLLGDAPADPPRTRQRRTRRDAPAATEAAALPA
jgi:RNA polymerase sigma-70 factor (ECF subfamily)